MKIITVPHDGHNLWLLYAHGTAWVPIKPLCERLGVDHRSVEPDTRRSPKFGAHDINMPLLGSVLCVPLRKLFGWLMSLSADDSGIDDAMESAWHQHGCDVMPGDGRLMLHYRGGRLVAARGIPDDWLIGSVDTLHDLFRRAGYSVMHANLHRALYQERA